MLKGINVLLGVTGGIACYKSCEIVSRLKKLEAGVDVVMTANATQFVAPLTFETLSNRPCVSDMFNRDREWEVAHISLAKKADVCVIAPATANVIAKLATGVADDMLTTTLLALKCPVIIAPAMNTAMYDNPTTQSNIATLKEKGYIFVDAIEGRLACGDSGRGKMAQPSDIVDVVVKTVLPKQDYAGKRVLVTAGATQENIDGVRFITNRSSGKMGIELAKAIAKRGGEVTLVAGIVSVEIPDYLHQVVRVKTTVEMYDAVMSNLGDVDVVIKAAAPSDYRPKNKYDNKIKGDCVTLELEKNPDIAEAVGRAKGDKKLVIFCAETTNLDEYAEQKRVKKNADMVVANDVTKEGAGFDSDTNVISIFTSRGKIFESGIMPKSQLAGVIADEIIKL
ncbi:MAG: bifunctional phosphopantothenoylcysteine decarboxylase/phosphopantothenate--cysteine ligase CoaBC [Clostridia bacterium]|nr:bifunctional phosphopantothenoylcysteine decarboxylase/phosphopantothenate--cysteine ligase CoaBC [Clostridia bacterium]MDY4083493.1 bifunctional phosphopantothenoylcysteine decarboxylase/phosphopantothenate--cysteine ligase CoaBC [Eubacteriales bacterium]